VQTKGGRSKAVAVTVLATAKTTGLEPDVAQPGQIVLVRGEASSARRYRLRSVVSRGRRDDRRGARVTIPPVGLPEGAKTSLVLQAGHRATEGVRPLHRPPAAGAPGGSPARAIGERVVIKGRGFLPDRLANTVTFGGQAALVLSASPNELTVVAPPPAPEMMADLPVVVTVAAARLRSHGRLPLAARRRLGLRARSSPGGARAAREALAFVSTELGPVLLLGAAADAASTPERAAKGRRR